jgi:hypothetical protein
MAAFSPAVVAPPLWLIAPALPPAGNGVALGPVGLIGCELCHSAAGPRQRSLPKAETRRGSVSRLGGE